MFICLFIIGIDNSIENTLKNVESLIPNKCDNIFNRYNQQLDEIEKYEGLMQTILQSLNKGLEKLFSKLFF